MQGKLSWNALPGPSCSPGVLPAVKALSFHGSLGSSHTRQMGGVCLAQVSPLVFYRDTALVSNEEFNHHVTLITGLFCKGRWERGHGINCMSHSYLCGAVLVLGFPWRLWRLQQHHSHPQQFSQCLQGKLMCVHTKCASIRLCTAIVGYSFLIKKQ